MLVLLMGKEVMGQIIIVYFTMWYVLFRIKSVLDFDLIFVLQVNHWGINWICKKGKVIERPTRTSNMLINVIERKKFMVILCMYSDLNHDEYHVNQTPMWTMNYFFRWLKYMYNCEVIFWPFPLVDGPLTYFTS